MKNKKPASGRSTPNSVSSGRSGRSVRTSHSTSREKDREAKQENRTARGGRHSVETSQPSAKGKTRQSLEAKPAMKKSRHSIETTKPNQWVQVAASTSRGAKRVLDLEQSVSSGGRGERAHKRRRYSDDVAG